MEEEEVVFLLCLFWLVLLLNCRHHHYCPFCLGGNQNDACLQSCIPPSTDVSLVVARSEDAAESGQPSVPPRFGMLTKWTIGFFALSIVAGIYPLTRVAT